MRTIHLETNSNHLHKALFVEWDYSDPPPFMRWDLMSIGLTHFVPMIPRRIASGTTSAVRTDWRSRVFRCFRQRLTQSDLELQASKGSDHVADLD